MRLLGSASIIAAANRNTPLADEILDALVRVAPGLSTEEEIPRIPQIMLQAAAAYEVHDAWFKWLEEGLARIATHLPPPPDGSLQAFPRPSWRDRESLAARLLVSCSRQSYSLGWCEHDSPHTIKYPCNGSGTQDGSGHIFSQSFQGGEDR